MTEVRAAATQLIARFAIDGKLPPSLVVERAADAAPVRMAVLGTVPVLQLLPTDQFLQNENTAKQLE